MRVLYFAALRERVGVPEEQVSLAGIMPATLGGLISALAARRPGASDALLAPTTRGAVNHVLAGPDTVLAEQDEVALFPPFTGG